MSLSNILVQPGPSAPNPLFDIWVNNIYSSTGTTGGTITANLFNSVNGYQIGGMNVLTDKGTRNLFLGAGSGTTSPTGAAVDNVFIGYTAGNALTSGYDNTLVGSQAGAALTSGYANTLVGYESGTFATTSNSNSALGSLSLQNLTTGQNNVSIGVNSGYNLTTGNNNIYLGASAGASSASVTDEVVIGSGLTGNGANTTTLANSIYISGLSYNGTLPGSASASSTVMGRMGVATFAPGQINSGAYVTVVLTNSSITSSSQIILSSFVSQVLGASTQLGLGGYVLNASAHTATWTVFNYGGANTGSNPNFSIAFVLLN